MQGLRQLNLAENLLLQLPDAAGNGASDWSAFHLLEEFWLYSNAFQHLPDSIFQCPALIGEISICWPTC